MRGYVKHVVVIIALICAAAAAGAQEAKNNAAGGAEKKAAGGDEKRIKIEIAEEPALVLGAVKITLSQAIEWAVKQNYDALAVSYDVAMLDTIYNQFQKKFDPVFSAHVGGNWAQFQPSQQSFVGLRRGSVTAGASIYKTFESGTTIAAGVDHEWYKASRKTGLAGLFSSMGGPAAAHAPNVYVSVQQELLKNAFGINDRDNEKIIKNSEKILKETTIQVLSLLIVGVIAEYWATVTDKVSLENAELQVRETKKVRDITARNAGYGLADDYTLNMYNSMLAGAEARMATARQKYRTSLRNFLSTINMDENTEITGTAIFSNKYQKINIEEALKIAYEKRADYQGSLLNLENAKLALKVAANSALPSLTAIIQGKTVGENKNFAESYGEVGQFQYPAIEGKLQMTYPLGNIDTYIQVRNARFKLKQMQILADKTKRGVKDDILNSVDNIETMYRLYQKSIEARRQSELFYQGMLRDLRLGRLSSAIAKNGLDALVQSREAELQSLVGYNLSLLMFDVQRNILFEKYNIDVEKYIPKDAKK